MEGEIARVVALLGVAMAVAIVARRLALPYTVGLVLTGFALALGRVDTGLGLTPEVVFDLILPPLLFEAALNLPWRELRRDLAPTLAFATLGVVLGAGVVASARRGARPARISTMRFGWTASRWIPSDF